MILLLSRFEVDAQPFSNSPINISMVKVELLTLIFFLGSLTLRPTARAFSQLAQKKKRSAEPFMNCKKRNVLGDEY